MSILQKDKIIFWATRYDRMNDPLEYFWAKEHIIPQMKDFANENNLNHEPDFEMFPYVISFCKSHDNLCMWNIYCNDGLGYILEFKPDIIKETAELALEKYKWNDILQDVTYSHDSNLQDSIKQTYDKYTQHQTSNDTSDLFEVCAFIKRVDYNHEIEVRYMRPNHTTTEFVKGNICYDGEDYRNIKFRKGTAGLIPYMEISFPKEALQGITIGYRYDFLKEKESLELFLKQNDYSNIEIHESKFLKR